MRCTAIINVVVACKLALCLGESQEIMLEKHAKGNARARAGKVNGFFLCSSCSHFLSQLASLTINGELADQLEQLIMFQELRSPGAD